MYCYCSLQLMIWVLRSCVLNVSMAESWWISLIDSPNQNSQWTLNRPLIDAWSTLHWLLSWHLIDISVYCRLTFNCYAYESLDSRLSIDWVLIKCQLRCRSSFFWISTKYQSGFQLSIYQHVNQVSIAGWLMVLTDTWLQMPVVHMSSMVCFQSSVNQRLIDGIDWHLIAGALNDFNSHDLITQWFAETPVKSFTPFSHRNGSNKMWKSPT